MKKYRIIYEDEWLLVVDKPAGMITLPFSASDENSLLHLLIKEFQISLFPCHRLDKDTSGLVIFAKDKKTQKKMMDLFREKKIKKKYIGVVHGWMDKKKGEIKNYLFDGAGYKLAITHYNVLLRKPEYSVLEIEPITGRKNQIRIHFKQLGHPMVGERKFAFAKDYELKSKRLLLHARELKFSHPRRKKEFKITSNLPEEFKIYLNDK